MVKHNLVQKYFHGCGTCRDCCNGKMFSLGHVTFADFKKIVRLFPTAFDMNTKQFLFFYSLVPLIGCHYYRDGNCSIYDVVDRPDTCLNFPFGIDKNHTLHSDYKACPQLNDTPNDFPSLLEDGTINPRVMNEFFTEFQYVSNLNESNKVLDDFISLVFESGSLKPFPIFKTTDGEAIDIKEIEANQSMMILDIEKITRVVKKMDIMIYDSFIQGHILSLENLPQFGKRLLQQI